MRRALKFRALLPCSEAGFLFYYSLELDGEVLKIIDIGAWTEIDFSSEFTVQSILSAQGTAVTFLEIDSVREIQLMASFSLTEMFQFSDRTQLTVAVTEAINTLLEGGYISRLCGPRVLSQHGVYIHAADRLYPLLQAGSLNSLLQRKDLHCLVLSLLPLLLFSVTFGAEFAASLTVEVEIIGVKEYVSVDRYDASASVDKKTVNCSCCFRF